MITIRNEKPADAAAIRRVNEQAFGQPDEAALVDALRRRGAFALSLVAVEGDWVVGHILFSPVTVESGQGDFDALSLAPMAVLPARQRQGIGSQLVRAGLEGCRQAGHEIVVVLGHPDYYPRFGFSPASQRGIACEFDAPDEAFMLVELRENALDGRRGVVRYPPEFHTL